MPTHALCFTCGQPTPVVDPKGDQMPVLNRLSDGRPCEACAERLLEALPAAMPRTGSREQDPA